MPAARLDEAGGVHISQNWSAGYGDATLALEHAHDEIKYAAPMDKPSILSRMGAFLTRVRNFTLNALFLVFLLIALFAVLDAFEMPEVPEGGALVIDPEGVMVEETRALDPFRNFWISDELPESGVHELVRAIDRASGDERIEMIVLKLDDLTAASAAHAELLGAALARFREAGKRVVSIGNNYSQSQYAIASYADGVYMHPEGAILLFGYGAFQSYYKALFDKLNLDVHVFRAGEYKEAVEPFIRDDMSEAAREANQVLVDGLWASYRQRILDNRQLDAEPFDHYTGAFDQALAKARGDTARTALESGLVDDLMSADQMRSSIADTVGWDGDGNINGIGYRHYLRVLGPPVAQPGNIGLIFVRGVIQMGDDRDAAAADNLVDLIRQARDDEAVRALVVRIDSPGGSAFASELIRQELELVQLADKPVVISMGSVAASGGYWVGATADRILAHPTTITGSIGIFSLLVGVDQAMSNIGVHTDGVGSTPFSDGFDPLRPLSDPMRRVMQATVDHGYRQFVNLVARGRDMDAEAVEAVAQGRVWLGSQALEVGLIDGLGGLSDAVAEAASLANLSDYATKRFSTPLSPRDLLIQQLMDAADISPPTVLASVLGRADLALKAFNDPRQTYAICEPCLSLTNH